MPEIDPGLLADLRHELEARHLGLLFAAAFCQEPKFVVEAQRLAGLLARLPPTEVPEIRDKREPESSRQPELES